MTTLSEQLAETKGTKIQLTVVKRDANAMAAEMDDINQKISLPEKIKDMNELLENMKKNCANAFELGEDLNDIDAYNAVSNILKKTSDAYVNFVKLVGSLTKPDAPNPDGTPDGEVVPQARRSLAELNHIVASAVEKVSNDKDDRNTIADTMGDED